MADVVLSSVMKEYPGGVTAVRQLDLAVSHGELLVLVGPSGCGKSTTLRMIAGLESITSGDLHIGGKRVNDTHPRDRDIAMVFQSYALYPHMTVRDNMAFGLTLRRTPRDEITRRVQGAADTLGIADLLDRKPKALSGGQRQRVAMGRAIVRQPAVFLFDEPLSNLDARLRVQMRLELSRLHAALGATMVYVTHDQVEAMTLADRIAVMDQGVLQQLGTPMEVYHRPANRFVAGFIGSPAMNFIEGQIERDEGATTFRSEVLTLPVPTEAGDVGRRVTAGIRPADLVLGASAPSCHGRVDVVEPMGAETFVYVTCASVTLVVRVDPETQVAVGETVSLAVDPDKVHLFGEDGGAIRPHVASTETP
ncbi:MAG: sn-glycerol-3-phosphate ABC transporter ATP-binding protein UgpC [Myxococcota bacterium]|nr:sn-glycerol-3-phosphate ABC transporter ATP-binding protein UgpC [Myxococcota bacterium]